MIDLNDVNVGDILYECQSGYNIKFEVMTRPEWTTETTFGKERRHWNFFGKNVYSKEIIQYGLTEGLEHYGPRLYNDPQYAHFSNGSAVFNFVGEEE